MMGEGVARKFAGHSHAVLQSLLHLPIIAARLHQRDRRHSVPHTQDNDSNHTVTKRAENRTKARMADA